MNPFEHFRADLAAAFTGSGDDADLEAVPAALDRAAGTPADAAGFLRSYVDVVRSGAPVPVGMSHEHPNGFTKISLLRDEAGWQARTHIWWGPSADVAVHDHRWSFSSQVLIGHLGVENFRRTLPDEEAGAPVRVVRYADADPSGAKALTPSDGVTLVETSRLELHTGDRHALRFTEPHLVRSYHPVVSATVMVTGPARRGYSNGYFPVGDPELSPDIPELMDRPTALEHLERLAEALDACEPIAQRAS